MADVHAYDAVPYPDFVHPRTDPDSIASMARLHGFIAADPRNSRILELGCGQGGNLISLASMYPESRCVGIDLSAGHIASGKSTIDRLGLTNIRLRAGDVCNFPFDDLDVEGESTFDFILVHGVYSWVPEEVRRHLLRIARNHLSPRGVAFFSYNTYPGWHSKGLVRDMVRYDAENHPEIDGASRAQSSPLDAIAEAKRFLADVAQSVPDSTGYGQMLRDEFRSILQSDEGYLFHEQFEAVNQPRYFHEFIDEIHATELRYVCESGLTFLPTQTEAMRRRLAALPMLRREQIIDYLGNRSFRQSLLCRADGDATPAEDPDAAAIESLWMSTEATCVSSPDFRVTNPDGASATLGNRFTQAAMRYLESVHPASVSWEELWKVAGAALDESGPGEAAPSDSSADQAGVVLQAELLQLAHVSMVRFHTGRLPLVSQVSTRPMASPLARWQSGAGEVVTSRRHTAVRLDAPTRHLITLCDGENDHAAITAAMIEFVSRDGVSLQHDGQPVTDPSCVMQLVQEKIGPNLVNLAKMGFLVS